MRRSLALSFITFLFLSTNAFADREGRMTGLVLDAATRKPIPNAKFDLEAIEGKTVKKSLTSRKDGKYTLTVLDATIRYKFTITADGYAPYVETIKIPIGEVQHRDFELRPGVAAAAAGSGSTETHTVQMGEADPAVTAYNEGATLINSGDVAGAIVKFDAAVAAKPDFAAGWMALAKANLRATNHQKAITAAKKALEFDAEDTDMWTILYTSYNALGDKANAAIAEKKLPQNASSLFNQAARLINQGKDAEAAGVLKQAVEADGKFALAWYELGMVYARTGKNAEARQALNKYLELDPKGKDAATAKEMLGYLN